MIESMDPPESDGEWAGEHLATYWWTLSPEFSKV